MTKAFLPIAFGLIVSMSVSRADDITLSDGTVLKNAKIVQRDDAAKTITISFSGGIAQVHSQMLPAAVAMLQPPGPPAVPQPTVTAPVPATPSATDSPMPTDWTGDGRRYHNVKVGDIEADRVHITYDGGLGTVQLSDLPPDLQKRFNYDPATAKQMTLARQQRLDASDAAVAQAAAQQQAQEQQEALVQEQRKNAVFVAGKVLQKVDGGVILSGFEEGEPYPWGDVPKGMHAYAQFDRVFVKGYDGEGVDGAVVEVTAFRRGTYSYTTVTGATSTIVQFIPVAQ